MLKAVFLDWGHTFTSTGFVEAKEKVNKLLKRYNLNWDNFYPYWQDFYYLRSLGKIKTDRKMSILLKRLLQKNIPFEKIQEVMIDSIVIPSENIDLVKKLKKNFKVGLLTNNVQKWVEKILKKYRIENLFDAIIVSSEVKTRKPDAKIFYFALKTLSVKPEESLFVSDELCDDLIGAKGCGIKTVWLDIELKNEKKRKERKIAKLFVPDAIIHNLQELLPLIENDLI